MLSNDGMFCVLIFYFKEDQSKHTVVMCQNCFPRPLYCMSRDLAIHKSMVLRNRTSMVVGFLRPLPPSIHIKKDDAGKFSYHEKVLFKLQII